MYPYIHPMCILPESLKLRLLHIRPFSSFKPFSFQKSLVTTFLTTCISENVMGSTALSVITPRISDEFSVF